MTQHYKPKNKIRIVTAASLFDGHDVSINIMRRVFQNTGAEIIHLGHNRSVDEIVNCAIQEDAHAIGITSYQGGHVEFFKYMRSLLDETEAKRIEERSWMQRGHNPATKRALRLSGKASDQARTCQ